MTKKCYECHFYDQKQGSEFCQRMMPELPESEGSFIALDTAREICNKEGDGIFVYFEPILSSPPARGGVAFASNDEVVGAAGAAVQPDDWRKEMNKHFGKAA